MLRLPFDLQNRTRSFLNTKEIYLSRCVCRSWLDVDGVPKSLIIDLDLTNTADFGSIPPPSMTNLVHLDFHFFISDESTSMKMHILQNLLHQSSKTLQSLVVYDAWAGFPIVIPD